MNCWLKSFLSSVMFLFTCVQLAADNEQGSIWTEYANAIRRDSASFEIRQLDYRISLLMKPLYQPYNSINISSARNTFLSLKENEYITTSQSNYIDTIDSLYTEYSNHIEIIKDLVSPITTESSLSKQIKDIIKNDEDAFMIVAFVEDDLMTWYDSVNICSYKDCGIPYIIAFAELMDKSINELNDPDKASVEKLNTFTQLPRLLSFQSQNISAPTIQLDFHLPKEPEFKTIVVDSFLLANKQLESIKDAEIMEDDINSIINEVSRLHSVDKKLIEPFKNQVEFLQIISKVEKTLALPYDSVSIDESLKELTKLPTYNTIIGNECKNMVDSIGKCIRYYKNKFQYDRLHQIVLSLLELNPYNDEDSIITEEMPEIESISMAEDTNDEIKTDDAMKETFDSVGSDFFIQESVFADLIQNKSRYKIVSYASYTIKLWNDLKECFLIDNGQVNLKDSNWKRVKEIRQELESVLE